jgi:lipopolysaccharide biosynthesis regulator YciM
MTKEEFDFEDAIHELGVLLSDDFNGLLISTLKKNFYEEYKQFDTLTAWDCFMDEVNRVNTVIELHDYLVENIESLKANSKVTEWIDKKIEEIKPYNSELCRATLLELKEYLE